MYARRCFSCPFRLHSDFHDLGILFLFKNACGCCRVHVHARVDVNNDFGSDVHCHELVAQQLCDVRHGRVVYRARFFAIGAVPRRFIDADRYLLLPIGRAWHGNQVALPANGYLCVVGLLEKAVPRRKRCAVGLNAVSLHFSDAQAAVLGPALHRLLRKHVHGAASTRVVLVVNHLLDSKVVRGPEKQLVPHRQAGLALVHDGVAHVLEAVCL